MKDVRLFLYEDSVSVCFGNWVYSVVDMLSKMVLIFFPEKRPHIVVLLLCNQIKATLFRNSTKYSLETPVASKLIIDEKIICIFFLTQNIHFKSQPGGVDSEISI